MTVPNFDRIETSSFDLSNYNRLIEKPLDNSGGRIKLGTEPGLGIAMNLDYLRGNSIDGFDDREIRA
jgi:galactonate dehydratase